MTLPHSVTIHQKEKGVSPTELIFLSAVFFVLFDNLTFFRHLFEIYPLSFENFFFLLSLSGGLTLVVGLFFTLITFVCPIKPVLILFLLVSSIAAYFMDTYDLAIDHTMIQNIIETSWDETYDLINLRIALYFFLLGLVPSYAVHRTVLHKKSFQQAALHKVRNSIIILVVIFAVILSFSRFYTSFFREHESLRFYSNPIYFVYSISKYIRKDLNLHEIKVAPLGLDAAVVDNQPEKKLVILVVGEAARADHFSLNGYSEPTNALLEKEEIVNFSRVSSCGTSTAYSVPCMFSVFSQAEFNTNKGKSTENVLDVLHHTGSIDVLWRDNNSDSKGVAQRIPYQDYRTQENNTICENGECRDEGMLVGLDQYIAEHEEKDLLIVLHQIGNHGPAYYKRYPKQFEQFTPTCQTNQLEDCTQGEIINAYDNALYYTGYFLTKTINFLKQYDKTRETAMFYFSDHGESLGENGVYLHGLPYIIAPEAQTHIGALMWFGEGARSDINLDLLRRNRDKEYSHDNLFHTLLGFFDVKTAVYRKNLDMLHH